MTPIGRRIVHSLRIEFPSKYNIIEYDGVIHTLQLIIKLGIEEVRLTSDSQLVIKKIKGRYQASDTCLQQYFQLAKHYMQKIPNITLRYLCKSNNRYIDALACIASMMTYPDTTTLKVGKVLLPLILINGDLTIPTTRTSQEALPEGD